MTKRSDHKVIITCAITGGIHTPTMSDALPYTPDDIAYRWSVLAAGRSQIPFATQAAMMGGNVRVGLEDSLHIGRGRLAASNAEQVLKVRRILEELGHEIATPADVRAVLALKGGDQVGF